MEIPLHAKRVFRGKIFDVYQWEQEMFDGSREIFEMTKRPDTVQILAVKGKKIVAAREDQPHLKGRVGFLGGMIDEGETPLAAAKRELREEAGFESDDWELWKVYEPLRKMDWKVYFYIARDCKKVAESSPDAGEKIEILEFEFAEFVKLYSSEEYLGGDFTSDLLRMRLDKKKLGEFREKLFPSPGDGERTKN